jgi:DNA invertase Pin-like site-specific DNA recombinase
MANNAWGYVRLSQEGRDASLAEQKKSIREYARAHDLNLQTTRNDGKNTSGFSTDRDEYQLLRDKLRNGEIDAVIVRDRARLSRDFDERLSLITDFRRTGVEWHVTEANGRLELEHVQQAMFECIHAGMDHIKKKIEIERSKQAVQERLDNGYYQGKPPYGLEFDDDGQYLVPSDEFAHVLTIFQKRDQGESYRSIAQDVPVSRTTVSSICDRREMYAEYAAELQQ